MRTPTRQWVPLMLACAAIAVISCKDSAPSSPIQLRDAWTRTADSGATVAVYLVLLNHSSAPVSLASEASSLAETVGLHETMKMGEMVHMMPLDAPPVIAPGDSLVLKEGGKHLMVTSLKRSLGAGDSLPLTVTLSDGRTLQATAIARAP